MTARQALRGACLALAAAGLLGLVSAPASAAAQHRTLEPSHEASCMEATDAALPEPAFPFHLYKRDLAGRVKVELHFTGPALRPAVTVLENEGDDEFIDAVKAYARTLRVPCMEAGHSVRLRQDYVFDTRNKSVVWSSPEDVRDAARLKQIACLVHESGSKSPDYPLSAQQQRVQGRLLVSLRFDAPDKPPVAKVHARRVHRMLASEVETWVRGWRLPCLQDGPVGAIFTFVFVIEGDGYGFKPLTLQQFMSGIKGLRQQTVDIDTTTMGCPFDVKLLYRQPVMPNHVGSIGPPNAARAPLYQWLAKAELDLSSASLDSVFADTADISVPCARIQLNPQEKSP